MKLKKHFLLIYIIAITLFTGYVMLDTFLIPRAETAAAAMNTSMFDGGEAASSSASDKSSQASRSSSAAPASKSGKNRQNRLETDNTSIATHSGDYTDYKDDNISVTIKNYTENNTKIYVADVKVSSAQYLKTALANDSYGKNITDSTSSIAESKNAIFAINGDYYGARESGYVIRNGVIYRDKGNKDTDVLCIYSDGHFEITNSGEKSAEELLAENVWQAFSFGPALVENGEIAVEKNEEVGRAMASNPRTAIGLIDNNHYIFVVSDGRTDESQGLTLQELAQFMQKLGVKTAYNLDGGGSSTMYYNKEIVNNPTTSGRNISERKVSDIVYIGY